MDVLIKAFIRMRVVLGLMTFFTVFAQTTHLSAEPTFFPACETYEEDCQRRPDPNNPDDPSDSDDDDDDFPDNDSQP